MASQNTDTWLLTLAEKVLKEYRKSTSKYRVRNKNAYRTIRKSLLDWLAQPVRREQFRLEDMDIHEQIRVIDYVIDALQNKRNAKARETRKKLWKQK
jgi:hypothetical protein